MAQVLLVDDDSALLEITQYLLESQGHSVATATNGEEALAVLMQRLNRFDLGTDLLITDLKMPSVDGLELIRRVRQSTAPVIRDIPTILMSGGPLEETQRLGIIAGADLVLPKPCDYLITAVNRVLGLR